VLPAAGDSDQVVGAAAQFLADVVDEKIDAAGLADDASQRRTPNRLAGGKDRCLDSVHPFTPARFRRQVVQLPIKQAFA